MYIFYDDYFERFSIKKMTQFVEFHSGDPIPIQFYCSVDLQPVLTSARSKIVSWEASYLVDIGLLYQKEPKSRFMKNFHEVPLPLI